MIVTHSLDLPGCLGPTPAACSDAILAKLAHDPATFALKAATRSDTVHGAVTIEHGRPHQILVELYDATEAPNADHDTTLARAAVRPSASAIRAALDTLKP